MCLNCVATGLCNVFTGWGMTVTVISCWEHKNCDWMLADAGGDC